MRIANPDGGQRTSAADSCSAAVVASRRAAAVRRPSYRYRASTAADAEATAVAELLLGRPLSCEDSRGARAALLVVAQTSLRIRTTCAPGRCGSVLQAHMLHREHMDPEHTHGSGAHTWIRSTHMDPSHGGGAEQEIWRTESPLVNTSGLCEKERRAATPACVVFTCVQSCRAPKALSSSYGRRIGRWAAANLV